MTRLSTFEGIGAVVTGASSGIGRLLAKRLASQGAHVALVARREEALRELADEIGADGGKALVVPCDVADREAVFAAAETAIAGLGRVHLLVNNAGYSSHGRFADWDLDDVRRIMDVNYFGSVWWTRAVLPHMVEAGGGHVVFVASVAGRMGIPGESVYSAAKFAVFGLAEAISMELQGDGVHVMAVCPGSVRTPFFGSADEVAKLPAATRKMMIEPDVVVNAIVTGLRKGRRVVTVPGKLKVAYWAKLAMPGFFRSQTMAATQAAWKEDA